MILRLLIPVLVLLVLAAVVAALTTIVRRRHASRPAAEAPAQAADHGAPLQAAAAGLALGAAAVWLLDLVWWSAAAPGVLAFAAAHAARAMVPPERRPWIPVGAATVDEEVPQTLATIARLRTLSRRWALRRLRTPLRRILAGALALVPEVRRDPESYRALRGLLRYRLGDVAAVVEGLAEAGASVEEASLERAARALEGAAAEFEERLQALRAERRTGLEARIGKLNPSVRQD